MKVYFLKIISLFPLLPVKITMAFVKLSSSNLLRLGLTTWNDKTYFVIGGFGYYLGLKFSFIKLYWGM